PLPLTISLHPALPICITDRADVGDGLIAAGTVLSRHHTDTYRHCITRRHASHRNSNPHNDGSLSHAGDGCDTPRRDTCRTRYRLDRKSTRLNSSHVSI